MKKAYLLQHSYNYKVEGIEIEETKVIGIYSSYKKAKEARKRLRVQKGFNRFPKKCFYIDEYVINEDHWTEGFITYDGSVDEWIE